MGSEEHEEEKKKKEKEKRKDRGFYNGRREGNS